MYFSIPELSRNRENFLLASLQASSACITASERLTQLAMASSAATLATQQRHAQGDEALLEHRENLINWFQEFCGIACETQVQLLTALETRIRGMDQIAQAAIARDIDTLPPENEPLLVSAKAAVDCVGSAVVAATQGVKETMVQLESAVSGLDAGLHEDIETEGGAVD